MSALFDRCFEIVLGHEGGYVNDPEDPGGETKFGIAKRSHPTVDIKNLTVAGAKAIYERDYWSKIQGDSLPPSLALAAFDSAVNSGVGQAARWLQRASGVTADGAIGPKTLAAARAPGVLETMLKLRLEMLQGLPTWRRFGKGWTRRIQELETQAKALERDFR